MKSYFDKFSGKNLYFDFFFIWEISRFSKKNLTSLHILHVFIPIQPHFLHPVQPAAPPRLHQPETVEGRHREDRPPRVGAGHRALSCRARLRPSARQRQRRQRGRRLGRRHRRHASGRRHHADRGQAQAPVSDR